MPIFFLILQETLNATHLLKLLDKMYKYEMDPTRTDRADTGCGTERRTDGVKTISPPPTPNNCVVRGHNNSLSPDRRQAIISTNAGILLIGPFRSNFREILIEIQTFSFRKYRLNVSSAKWRAFCLGLNELNRLIPPPRLLTSASLSEDTPPRDCPGNSGHCHRNIGCPPGTGGPHGLSHPLGPHEPQSS